MYTGLRVFILIILFISAQLFSAEHQHHEHDHSEHQSHAPVGVMGDHYHEKGEFMLSYRAMRMSMDENFNGSSSLSVSEALSLGTAGPGPNGEYMMMPVDMTMDMHMLGMMYAVNSKLTLMLMANYLENEMNIEMLNGTKFSTKSSGFSDTKLSALFELNTWGMSKLLFGFGVSLPTGSIDEKDDTPASAGVAIQLPYPMQLGSGTYDLLPSLTLTHQSDSMKFAWGAQLKGEVRMGDNDHGYALGDSYNVLGWGSYVWNSHLSNALRLNWKHWGDIDGSDSQLTVGKNMMPTADPGLRGGRRLDLGFGINLLGNKSRLYGHKIALEYTKALYQNLNGPQLGTDNTWVLGYEKVW